MAASHRPVAGGVLSGEEQSGLRHEARDTVRGPRGLVHRSTSREWQGQMIGRIRRFGRSRPPPPTRSAYARWSGLVLW